MLDTVPHEVLTLIALHLSLPTLQPCLPLLLTCKGVYDAISPSTNPRLYSRIFRASFDIAAVERRRGEIHAKNATAELKKRGQALRRIKAMCDLGSVLDVQDEDLWMVYIMLIENDGKNIRQLMGRNPTAPLLHFLRLYHEQHFLTAAVAPGYPSETISRSLVMWIAWLIQGHDETFEVDQQRDERLFVLRPYVFASHRYELCYAPWTIPELPLALPHPQRLHNNPFMADLAPKSRTVEVEHFGRKIEICPPMLSHASILRFFSKPSGQGLRSADGFVAPFSASGRGSASNGTLDQVGQDPGRGAVEHLMDDNLMSVDVSDEEDEDEQWESGSNKNLLATSTYHDRDFARLTSCHDPFFCRGMKPATWRGTWEGCWEGTFSFFDFDAFREMLAGNSRALYEGPYGEQAQVWRLKETYVRRKEYGSRPPSGSSKGKHKEELNEQPEDGMAKVKGLPLKGPMTNAGFPTDQPASLQAGLAGPSAEAATMRETIRQQVDAIEGYEAVLDEELDEAFGEDGGETQGLEMILTGVGHSAWGRFILKGRVRVWDGLASLVKEYAPDSRGRWIYRGYVGAGDTFVGRWRDTFTPEEFVGYEGTFILNRR